MIIRQYGKTYTIFDGLFSKWGLCVIAAAILAYIFSEIFNIDFVGLGLLLIFGLPFIALIVWIIKFIIEDSKSQKREKEIKKEIEIFKVIHRRELKGLNEIEIRMIYELYKDEIDKTSNKDGAIHENEKK